MQDQESDGQAVKGMTESAGKVTKGKNKRQDRNACRSFRVTACEIFKGNSNR
jgi:hypothetical protein